MRFNGKSCALSSFGEIEEFTNFAISKLISQTAKGASCVDDEIYTRITLALCAIGESDPRNLGTFLSNRYFLDACGITSLPDATAHQTWLDLNKTALSAALKAVLPAASCASDALDDIILRLVEFWHAGGATSSAVQLYGREQREKLREDGYCIIPSVFDPAFCAETKQELLHVAAAERARQSAYHFGKNNRFQRVYNIITKTAAVRSFLAHPLVNVVMDDLFDRQTLHDKYYLSSFHANFIPVGGEAQKLHVDAAVPEPLPSWIVRANVNFLLEDYVLSNGATLCIPGSHRWGRKPGSGDEIRFSDQMRPIEGAVGLNGGLARAFVAPERP